MRSTWQDLLDNFWRVRNGDYRSEPEHQEAIIEEMAFVIQTILEKLRDLHDPQ
jgi:hypothetical protein